MKKLLILLLLTLTILSCSKKSDEDKIADSNLPVKTIHISLSPVKYRDSVYLEYVSDLQPRVIKKFEVEAYGGINNFSFKSYGDNYYIKIQDIPYWSYDIFFFVSESIGTTSKNIFPINGINAAIQNKTNYYNLILGTDTFK